jgi:hypothetical protein
MRNSPMSYILFHMDQAANKVYVPEMTASFATANIKIKFHHL